VPRDTVKSKRKVYNSMLNNNSFTFIPSSDIRVGTYQLVVSNISTSRSTQTANFEIRRKIPLGVVIAAVPIVAAGVAAIIFLTPKNNTNINTNIADPPSPPQQ
jgi:hypothetical protein